MTLAETIRGGLEENIRSGNLPYSLTLRGIAEHYGVSFMPVRVAIAALIDERLLVRQYNGRLEANPAVSRTRRRATRTQVRRPDPPDKRLADHIIHLSLTAEAKFVREEATAERFNIGRTVVRRVFNRLAGERLIEHVPRRGWLVHPYRETDMQDFLDVREILELRALELARTRLDAGELRRLLEANSPDQQGNLRLNNDLHQYWVNLADSRYIREFLRQYGVYFQALFDRAALDRETVAEAASEHREILTALIERDWKRAERALSQHIRAQRLKVARMKAHLAGEAAV